jgi:hypothetical protein
MIHDQELNPGQSRGTILPVAVRGRTAVEFLGPALTAEFWRVLSPVSPQDLLGILDEPHLPNVILLDVDGDVATSISVQAAFQGHTAWCTIPVVVVNACVPARTVANRPVLMVQPEASFEGVPEVGLLADTLHAVVECKEPCYQIRRLERNRHQVRLSLGVELQQIDGTMTSLIRAVKEVSNRLVEAQKKLSALRSAQNRMGVITNSNPGEIEDWIGRQAVTIASYREQIHAFETERRELLLRRHRSAKTLQADLQELDRQIFVLSEVVRCGRSLGKGVAPPSRTKAA